MKASLISKEFVCISTIAQQKPNSQKSIFITFMRIGFVIAILQIVSLQLLFAKTSNSQSLDKVFINVGLNNETLVQAFKKVETQTAFRFMYFSEDVSAVKNLNLPSSKISIEKLLNVVLTGTQLTYQQMDNQILIRLTPKNNQVVKIKHTAPTLFEMIRGTITNSAGTPLASVSVTIKGTTKGTSTDQSGKYSLEASPKDILVFSSVGFFDQEITVGSLTQINVEMQEETKALNEVVVSSLGVKRQKKSLGYAVQEVKGSALNEAATSGLVNAMSGKISGVQITSSNGAPGSSSRVQIRGASSISGNNEPLFVVDGVPIDNGNYSSGSTDYGNGASAINPEDVESMSVLKGPAAAAIYGSRGANGVILITTKSGKGAKGLGVEVNSTTTFERPFRISDYQNEYGQGTQGAFSFVDGKGGGINDGVDESWGPKLDGRLLPQFDSPLDTDGKRIPTPWVAHPDNVKDFYQLGRTLINNVAIVGANDKGDFKLSYNNQDIKGIMPNNGYHKNTISLNSGYKIHPRITVRASASYIKDGSDNRSNSGAAFTWFGRQVDISKLKQYILPGQTDQYNWNYNYSSNPYYVAYESTKANEKDRLFGNITLNMNVTNWLDLLLRSGTDFFNDRRQTRGARFNATRFSNYSEEQIFVRENNSDFLFTIKPQEIGKFTAGASFGGNSRYNYYQRNYAYASQLSVHGVYNLRNSRLPIDATNYSSRKKVNSLYAAGQFSYNNYLFLDVTARNDWSSTLPKENNSYFYPSASLSFILSEAVENLPDWLNYAKIRTGVARVGNDTEPYRLRQTYAFQQGWDVTPMVTGSATMLSPDIKPEITSSFEAGTELRFLNSRLGLDVTYYTQKTKNQILNANISNTSGFTSVMINAGEIANSGFEISLVGTPVSTSGFKWETMLNYSKNNNKVLELADGLVNYQLGTFNSMSIEARVGQPYGTFFGSQYLRAPDGQIIYKNGLPQTSSERRILGSFVPDWIGGFSNTFTFKGISIYTLVDARIGGDLFSYTILNGRYAGVLKETLLGREEGIIGVGVVNVGTDKDPVYKPNDVRVSSEDWHHSYYFYNNNEAAVFDASYVKLREVRIGFNLPQRWVQKTPFKKVNVAAIGRNLALLYSNVPHIDPETSYYGSNSNVQGIEYSTTVSNRSVGFAVNFSF